MNHSLRIAVFGSWRSATEQRRIRVARGLDKGGSNDNTETLFQDACRQLGSDIAASGHLLLVASDSSSTVDFHIVQGVLETSAKVTPSIQVIRSGARRSSKGPDDCMEIFKKEIRENGWAFELPIELDRKKFPPSGDYVTWTAVHEHIVELADRVLIIGGGSSTHAIANLTLSLSKPVVPVGAFGGAASDILKMLQHIRDAAAIPRWEYRDVLSSSKWGSSQLETSLYALGVKSDPKKRKKVFINYRRDDSNSAANFIRSELLHHLSVDEIFLDTHSIKAGDKFESVIKKELDLTKIFLCVIGPNWLSQSNPQTHQRRLDEVKDFVRREIEIALRDNIHVIPVFVEGAGVPARDALPSSIKQLIEYNAVSIPRDNMPSGIEALVDEIQKRLY